MVAGIVVAVVAAIGGFLAYQLLASDGEGGDGGAGEIPAGVTDARDIQADEIAVGDCIDWPDPDAEVIDLVIGIPCDQPHDAEVYAIPLLAAGADQPHPGFDGLLDEALDLCTVAFGDYVGVPYELDETYFFDFFSPTEESWVIGDREIVCLAYRIDEAKMTATVRAGG